ncbi:glycosyltransferase [Gibbsiella quercinecans]|nr:glycosyltransferase [Gibbsiella quercinecans]
MRELNLKPSKVHQILENNGFVFEQDVNVWRPATLPEFAYSDGDDAENYVLDAVTHADDLSVNSLELAAKMKDWPSTYHLTSRRSNLLKPFRQWFAGKRILEIGCGCGAITRFLAECGAQVVSVEGSFRRAQIARQRCRDLPNVDVICSPSDILPDLGAFDGVMLIGVLEYARMFLGKNGQNTLLDFCRQRLVKDGKLFVAIENKLGIKYFAGANEDHVGQPMFGINNSYTESSVATFGRHELLTLLNQNGFIDTQEYIPLPDYKLPVSIVTPIGWRRYSHELSQLAIESSNKDIQGVPENLFSVEQGTRNAWSNGLAVDLANSFLVVASQQTQLELTPGVAAYHYSDGRLPEFNKITTFEVVSDGELVVNSVPLVQDEHEGAALQRIKSVDAFYSGNSLWLDLVDIVNRPDWSLTQVALWAKEWIDSLLSMAKATTDYDKDFLLKSHYQDAMPFNAIRQKDNSVVFFDLEWHAQQDITLGYAIFRGIFHSLLRLTSVAYSQHLSSSNIVDISYAVVREIGFAIEPEDLKKYLDQESEFMASIENKDSHNIYEVLTALELPMRIASVGALKNQLTHIQDEYLRSETQLAIKDDEVRKTMELIDGLKDDVSSLQKEIETMHSEKFHDQISAKDAQIAALQHNIEVMEQHIAQQTRLLAEYEHQVWQILHSSSWKLSAPLRVMGRRVPVFLRKPTRLVFHRLFYIGQRCKLNVGKILHATKRVGNRGLAAVSCHPLMAPVKRNVREFARSLYYRLPEGYKGRLLRLAMKLKPSWFLHHPAYSSVAATHSVDRATPATFISHHRDGMYHFAKHPDEYVYIPTQRPYDLEEQLNNMQQRPRFSIIVPIYNTPLDLLEKMVNSVRSQWYSDWQLILANDASPLEETKKALDAFNDPKIKVIHMEKNQGIAGATNVAIDNADGDFIVFLDHDDELTDDCLYELALCINREDPDFIYSDEDKFTPDGDYSQPHFKPDWSPDTMMGTMYTCHVACVRLSVAKAVGGLRSEFNGCQDWDFILRLTEITHRISHIPKILYHWRIIPASVASDMTAKPYVLAASRAVRESALERRGLKGTVEELPNYPGYFRVNYALRDNACISIIVPTRDNHVVLKRCIESILDKTAYRNFEIIIVDNGSKDAGTLAYLEMVSAKEQISVVRHDAPFNFSELNNLGSRQAKGELLLFLNDDTEVLHADWLERMGGYAQLSHVGAVGAKLLYGDGATMQHAGVINLQNGPMHAYMHSHKDIPGYFLRNQIEYNWLIVTGACLMVERRKFEQVGGFNEQFPVAYNDVDLCMRLCEAGLYNVMCQSVTLIHHESVSRGLDHMDQEKVARLQRELGQLNALHPHFFQYDPFYNVNFAPNSACFEIRK